MSYGELALVVGDVHDPSRALSIPSPFKKLLQPGKMQHVLCTGNTSPQTLAFLRRLCKDNQQDDFHCVTSPISISSIATPLSNSSEFPEKCVVEIGHPRKIRVGLINGYQVVPPFDKRVSAAIAREMNVHMLVCGGAVEDNVYEFDGKWFVFPGSLTGTNDLHKKTASFLCLSVQTKNEAQMEIVVYSYRLDLTRLNKRGKQKLPQEEKEEKKEDLVSISEQKITISI